MSTLLLKTKLYIPPTRPDPSTGLRTKLVSHPRLIERLNAGLHRKLTLISAPAGFGKTTLVSEWIHSGVSSREYGVGSKDPTSERPSTPHSLLPTPSFAWLSLDESDNDPVRFLAYSIAALQTIEARQESAGNIGKGALSALQSPQPPPNEAS